MPSAVRTFRRAARARARRPQALLLACLALAGCVAIETSGPYEMPRPAEVVPFDGHSLQRGQVRFALDTSPAVMVLDSAGVPAEGVLVTFTPRPGSGTVIGGSVRTDRTGIARVGQWVLGQEVGIDTLVATVAGLPATTITAQAVDPCRTDGRAIAPGDTLTGVVTDTTCRAGELVVADQWVYAATASQPMIVEVRANGYQPFVDLRDRALEGFAVGDSVAPGYERMIIVTSDSGWVLRAGAQRRGALGPYTLSVTPTDTINGCRRDVWVTRGVLFESRVDENDCVFSPGGTTSTFYAEALRIALRAQSTVTLRMSSGDFAPVLQVLDGTDTVIRTVSAARGSTATLGLTVGTTAVYTIVTSATSSQTSGRYILEVAP